MKVAAFIRAFGRFTARRGNPDITINDNFKTFKSSNVKKFMLYQGIRQRFILPASPWWGGFYERLVRTVKMSLKKVLGKALLTYEELETALCEIESVINNRPLFYTSEDDLGEALTPNHLIYGRNIMKNSKINIPEDIYKDCSKRYKYVCKVINDQWKRFHKVYLNELRQHHVYRNSKHSKENSLRIGDVVLIKDDTHVPRSQWRLGKVEKLIVGKDNRVRGAKLTVISKGGERTTCSRPVQKLIPFEIVEDDANHYVNEGQRVDKTHTNDRRPTRKAKIEGQYLRRLNDIYS